MKSMLIKKEFSFYRKLLFKLHASFTACFFGSGIQEHKIVVKFIQFNVAVFVDFASQDLFG